MKKLQDRCYREAGRFIQWCDEALLGKEIFEQKVADLKSQGIRIKIAKISDGRRLFREWVE